MAQAFRRAGTRAGKWDGMAEAYRLAFTDARSQKIAYDVLENFPPSPYWARSAFRCQNFFPPPTPPPPLPLPREEPPLPKPPGEIPELGPEVIGLPLEKPPLPPPPWPV